MLMQRVSSGFLRQTVSSNKGRLAHTTCDAPPQYDVSEKMKKLFDLKRNQREETKAYYQKIIMNPYRAKVDPVPFDPIVFRYNALMTYNAEYFKPNLSNTALFFGFYIIPTALLTWFVSYFRNDYEKQLRAGEIAYEDRRNLNIL